MSTLYVTLGPTGSGKSEVCNYFEQEYGMYNFHPIGFLKRWYEKHYEMSRGSLDTREGKNYKPPGANSTMQQMMVGIYHFYREHDPEFSTRNLRVELKDVLASGQNVTAQAIRNAMEVSSEGAILDIVKRGSHKLVVIELLRDVATPETSDDQYEQVKKQLVEAADEFHVVENNGTIAELIDKVDEIAYSYLDWNEHWALA